MDYKTWLEIKKFKAPPVFFTDRKKISDFKKVIINLPPHSLVIIREYDLPKEQREVFAKKIVDLARSRCCGLKILTGKDFNLAKKIKADGIHFSDHEKLPLGFLRKKSFPKKFIFSLACHSLKSARKLSKSKPNMIFISPIFPTDSHIGKKAFGLTNFKKVIFQNQNKKYFFGKHFPKIYALGGVDSSHLKLLRKIGTSGFGAISFFNDL